MVSERYDYQPETIRRLLRHGRMIARVATGGGKSNICALAISTLRLPTLFLTTRSVLMYQMKDHLEKCGFVPGVLGDSVWAPRKGVNVGMVQTLVARLAEGHPEREKTLALLKYFRLVIGEEAHEAGGNSYYDILQHCTEADYRLALTATPFMRSDEEANMRLMAAFGPIGITVSEKTLIDRGILARPIFKFLDVGSSATLRRSTRWPTCYEVGIVENQARNLAFVEEIARGVGHGLTGIMLIQRKNHGQILEGMLRDRGIRATFIFGDSDQAERREALTDLAKKQLDVLVGSTILDVGVDVPSVGMVANAGGGKAEVAIRQRIGRGLREKKQGPNICHVVDSSDKVNKTLQEHALLRRAIIEGTEGFSENILPVGRDFDYASFKAAA